MATKGARNLTPAKGHANLTYNPGVPTRAGPKAMLLRGEGPPKDPGVFNNLLFPPMSQGNFLKS